MYIYIFNISYNHIEEPFVFNVLKIFCIMPKTLTTCYYGVVNVRFPPIIVNFFNDYLK